MRRTANCLRPSPLLLVLTAMLELAVRIVAAGKRPNFIVFQPDDMPFYDNWGPPPNKPSRPRRATTNPGLPNMEKVRSEGVSFSNAYVVSPACGTSRFATLTGRYPSRSESGRAQSASSTRTKTTIPSTKLIGADCANNVPFALKSAGYRTGVAGKWHLATGQRTSVPSYAEQQKNIESCGFTWADGIYLENFDSGAFASSGDLSHNMEWVTAKAIEFIESGDEPFFLYFNPTVPHTPSVEAALNDYACTKTPSGVLQNEPQVEGMTKGSSCAAYRSTVISRNSASNEKDKDTNLGSIWSDDALGALMTALSKKGALDNTFIAVMMDHGVDTKMALFENGARVALSVRYPPIASAGSVYKGLVSNIDLARTILDLAQVEPSFGLDGLSLASEVQSVTSRDKPVNSSWENRCVFMEYELDRAVRCGCGKLISIGDTSSSTTLTRAETGGYSTVSWQFYDLCSENGAETNNIYRQSPDIVSQMKQALTCHEERTDPRAASTFEPCNTSSVIDLISTSPDPASLGYGPLKPLFPVLLHVLLMLAVVQ
eukprot:TRINITY_DN64918_c0_g1_i1.p1 TRINITY_DN64918_c0_g1~~TRINITY_DN64918_c0_g1_i1.p1  ORF type:complete len:544 (-),score=52.82 TRINITY_DN64918_c0_g1_i1:54-1685(-)